ncbi:MAG TPA: hypothetical protein VIF62_33920 [Labilithrix sp.]
MGFWDWLFGKGDGDAGAHAPEAPRAKPAEAPPPRASPPAQPSAAPAQPSPKPKTFGIEQAIELMRKLPLDEEPELVLRVVRKTLRSTGVSLEEIVRSAKQREASLGDSVAKDKADIERLEREIAERRASIERATAQANETRKVRERLQDALSNESVIGLLVPPEVTAAAAASLAKQTAPSTPKSIAPKQPPKVSKPPPPLPSKAAPKMEKPDIPSLAPPEDNEETAKVDVELPRAAVKEEDSSGGKP